MTAPTPAPESAPDTPEGVTLNELVRMLDPDEGAALVIFTGEAARDYAAALRAALARPSPAPSEGWRDTAASPPPMDGTRILAWFGPDVGAHAVAWEESLSGTTIWCVDDNKHGPYALRGYNTPFPTFWQPIAPPAPSAPAPDAREAARVLLAALDDGRLKRAMDQDKRVSTWREEGEGEEAFMSRHMERRIEALAALLAQGGPDHAG